jgi:flavorubredoxin
MDVSIEKITDEIHLLRMDDDRVEHFEALWRIPEGITYNAYLMRVGNTTLLFDGWKKEYQDEFVDALSELVDPRDIDYIVVHHMEPDHSGTLRKILEENGYRATVLGHRMVGRLMKSFYGLDGAKFRAVEDGEEIEIEDKRLRFTHVPWLHWPDSIFSYLDGVLFTCDAFGGYSIPKAIFDESGVSDYLPFVRKYIVNIVGRYKEQIVKNIQKVVNSGITPKIILPSHGLLWKNPQKIINYYLDVANGVPEKGKVLVVYSSMYGFVEEAANTAIKELERQGYKPKVLKFTDKAQDNFSDIISEAADSEAIVLGTATYEMDVFPLMRYVVGLLIEKANYDKPVLILSSYGWGGAAVKVLREMFSGSSFRVVDSIEFGGEAQEEKIREGVKNLLGALDVA